MTPANPSMIRLCQKFLLYLAAAFDRELVRQVEYLKTENQILRSKLPKRITVTLAERNRLGNRPLDSAAGEPPTILAFPRGEKVCEERLGGLLKHYYRQAA